MLDWVLQTLIQAAATLLNICLFLLRLNKECIVNFWGFPFHLHWSFSAEKNDFSKEFLFCFCSKNKQVNG